ncbi:MAG: hypothetical protein K8R23_01795 [Chthoniobacter sp.]|nr:hypothetical protein [Chthoniobacter sp.]
MSDQSNTSEQPNFSAESIKERLKQAAAAVKLAALFARELDWIGAADSHPEGSEQQRLAGIRDEVDFALGRFFFDVRAWQRMRAEFTRCSDLLVPAAIEARGDGPDALHLMRRYDELCPGEADPAIDPGPESFPDSFAWDTYLRVCALGDLAKEFPLHLRHSARQMHGWPMIVSNHLDTTGEFQAVVERLEVGAGYPLDVGARRKRGTETPLLHYLEPLVWRLFVLWEQLTEAAAENQNPAPEQERRWRRGPIPEDNAEFARYIRYPWCPDFYDSGPKLEELPILRRLVALPPLTRKSARQWSHEVIVPLIMLRDAGTRETCKEPALRNIWQHRSVKSLATFRSRLHSAVTDTLQRFGRPDQGGLRGMEG